jgi:hypothetical protein
MKNKILLPLILIFFVACDYPFFAVQEENKPEVVISAFFCPDSLVRVKIEPWSMPLPIRRLRWWWKL